MKLKWIVHSTAFIFLLCNLFKYQWLFSSLKKNLNALYSSYPLSFTAIALNFSSQLETPTIRSATSIQPIEMLPIVESTVKIDRYESGLSPLLCTA